MSVQPRRSLVALVFAVALLAGPASQSALAAGGSISGHVTDDGGQSLQGICVSAQGTGGGGSAQTDTSGNYTISSLPAGSYKVGFSACLSSSGNWVRQYFNGKPDLATADVVAVADDKTTPNIDAQMQPGGRITGHVTDAEGKPVPRICVLAQGTGAGLPSGSAQTDAAGNYTIRSLTPGSYKVGFSACSPNTDNWVRQYYSGKPDASSADAVAAVAGETTAGIDAQMQPGGRISGHVTDADGHPLQGICVSTLPEAGGGFGSAQTDANGDYTVASLAAGAYRVGFAACSSAGNWVTQYYDGEPSLASADPVAVTAGATTAGIDAQMQPGGRISGHVTDGQGNALQGICVSAQPAAGGGMGGGALTDTSGNYTIAGLAAGTYTVGFSACTAGDWLTQSLDGVSVTGGATTGGIDAQMRPGGKITGHVTGEDGKGLAGICVGVFPSSAPAPDSSLEHLVAGTITDPDGDYSIPRLPPDTYKVGFANCPSGGGTTEPYTTQWYSAKAGWAAADTITLAGGELRSGIDARMAADRAPVCADQSGVAIAHGTATALSLGCTDPDGDALTYAIVSPPPHGTLSTPDGSGKLTYTPAAGYAGPDSFTFKAGDGRKDSSVATVRLDVGAAPGGNGQGQQPAGTQSTSPSSLAAVPVPDVSPPVVSGLTISPATFRLGSQLARITRSTPVGTTISFRLSEPARTTLAFSQPQPGRRAAGRCRRLARSNRGKPRCTIPNLRGVMTIQGHAGLNTIRFQGRLSRTRRLRPGRFTLTITAIDAARNISRPKLARLRIVR